MILLIDNYDSFTYNLYQYMGIFDRDIQVVRNDKITVDEIKKRSPEKIVLSPGPRSPEDAGICVDVVRKFYDKIPILGICLGHQSIGAAFGAEIVHAKALMHGKQSLITHSGRGIFRGIPNPVRVARYHSRFRPILKYLPELKTEKSWLWSTGGILSSASSFTRSRCSRNMAKR